jgi:hypothetical protein
VTIRFESGNEIDELLKRNPDIKINEDHLTKPDKKAGKPKLYDLPLCKESESDFQTWVIKTLKDNGWRVAHFRGVKIQRRNGSVYYQTPVQADGAGWPDIVAVHEQADYLLAIELKTKSGTLSPDQEKWLLLLAKVKGVRTLVARPEDRDKIIRLAEMREG